MCIPKTLATMLLAASTLPASPPVGRLQAVPFTDVHVQDEFWKPRLETNRTVTLPHCLKECEDTGRINNFRIAAGHRKGEFAGRFYNDSDVYKVIEGAAYCLAQQQDPKLEATIDAIIDEIAAAQQPDGYLNSYYTVAEPGKRWTSLNVKHELYCAGHLFEAGVAYAQATGKTRLLEVCRRMADHIDGLFGPGKRVGWPGHQEIELALVKLSRYTGERRYADLAKFFLDVRGTFRLENNKNPEYNQAHKPIREQTDIVGHSVRAMYMLAGVADVAGITGDEGYIRTMDTIWHNVADRKMYITGGVGARHGDEAFGDNYELPNEGAYCETCAAIALAFWNQRMLLLHADGRYADVVERAMYNGILAGVSLKGDTFFYVNPLASRGNLHRQPWFNTACCPSNIVRFIPSIPGYVYATGEGGIWVNQYMAGQGRIALPSGRVTLTQRTDYPWSGEIALAVEPPGIAEFELNLRIPRWWGGEPRIRVAGEELRNAAVVSGYVHIRRAWKPGDTVQLTLPMAAEWMYAHPNVIADHGRAALQRGPLVYCVEAVDNGGRVSDLVASRGLPPAVGGRIDLPGVQAIRFGGVRVGPASWAGRLYQSLPAGEPVEITAIPYFAWDHRAPGEMTVWIAQGPDGVATQPAAVSDK
jgi:DUF1680 family protein